MNFNKYKQININGFKFDLYGSIINGKHPHFYLHIVNKKEKCIILEMSYFKRYDKTGSYILRSVEYEKKDKGMMMGTGARYTYIEENSNRFSFKRMQQIMISVNKEFKEKVLNDYKKHNDYYKDCIIC